MLPRAGARPGFQEIHVREVRSLLLVELAERKLAIPEGVQIQIEGRKIKATGPKGTLEEDFGHLPVKFALEDKTLRIYAPWARKREVALVGTALAHLRNMVRGVTSGFTYKLKIVYAHFPVTVKINEKEKKLTIDNFTGEKTARVVKIIGSAKVKLASDEIHVQGISLADVSQTAANIQYATKIPDKDQRVFLDGIYIFEKKEGM
jgi:large subunit ribosomal protein L6